MKTNRFKPLSLLAAALVGLSACDNGAAPAAAAQQPPAAGSIPAAATAALIEGKDYIVLPTAVPQRQADKIEVVEFFSYICPHCKNLEPVLNAHSKNFPADTYLRGEHVVWDPAMKPLARLAAAVEIAGEKTKADGVIFDAVFNKNIDLADEAAAKKWLAEQTAFDGKKVLAAYESSESQVRADEMEKLTAEYQISGTPTVIVGGQYAVQFDGGWEAGMQTIDRLAEKIRSGRGAAK